MTKKKLSLNAPEDLSEKRKSDWQRGRNFIAGPMVIVTTSDQQGVENAALKTNFMSMGSLDRVAFGCKVDHDTYKNIVQTEEFVANLPPREIIEETMVTAHDYPKGVSEIEEAGLTSVPSNRVKAPRIKECLVHYECELDWYKVERDKEYSVTIMGKIVAASVEKGLTNDELDNLLFWIGGPDESRRVSVVGERIDFSIAQFLSKLSKNEK